jgi:hypothetical protein
VLSRCLHHASSVSARDDPWKKKHLGERTLSAICCPCCASTSRCRAAAGVVGTGERAGRGCCFNSSGPATTGRGGVMPRRAARIRASPTSSPTRREKMRRPVFRPFVEVSVGFEEGETVDMALCSLSPLRFSGHHCSRGSYQKGWTRSRATSTRTRLPVTSQDQIPHLRLSRKLYPDRRRYLHLTDVKTRHLVAAPKR